MGFGSAETLVGGDPRGPVHRGEEILGAVLGRELLFLNYVFQAFGYDLAEVGPTLCGQQLHFFVFRFAFLCVAIVPFPTVF